MPTSFCLLSADCIRSTTWPIESDWRVVVSTNSFSWIRNCVPNPIDQLVDQPDPKGREHLATESALVKNHPCMFRTPVVSEHTSKNVFCDGLKWATTSVFLANCLAFENP